MKIYKTFDGYVMVESGTARNFNNSLKQTSKVGVSSGFAPIGTLLSGKSLRKDILFGVLKNKK